jgi:putative component of membrane protein insertase Oxa1/YidC/SpoIIIJ protein YidD
MTKFLLWFIRLYQKHWQPETGCLYTPICSDYAYEAISIHGPKEGLIMAAERIKRCKPIEKEVYFAAHPELGSSAAGNDPCPGRRRVHGDRSSNLR